MKIKRLANVAIAVGVATVAGVMLAAPADASNGRDFNGYGIHIHSAPSTSSAVVGEGNHGDGYTWIANDYGTAVRCDDGSVSIWWDKITDDRTHVTGWASECYLWP